MNILDLLVEDRIKVVKVASTSGGEYASACPDCGGEDRFRCWPSQGDTGRYWCRGCGKSGDAIQYLRDFRGLGFVDACQYLSIEPRLKRHALSWTNQADDWQAKDTTGPAGDKWLYNAKRLLKRAVDYLWSTAGERHRQWLHNERFLLDDTIKQFQLGWIPANVYHDREVWGLDTELKDDGTPKKIMIPSGLLIPMFHGDTLHRLKIRRDDPGEYGRYYIIKGSGGGTFEHGQQSAVIIVESELDAMLLFQEVGDLVSVVALGAAQNKPDRQTTDRLTRADCILVSLDVDEAGGRQSWQWWIERFRNAKRWPTIKGKDPTEARAGGLDLRKWILAGLPPVYRLDNHDPKQQLDMSSLTRDEREQWEERAARMEYDGGLSREDAERQALDLILQQRAQQ